MSERSPITHYIPEDQRSMPLEVREDLTPVIDRIARVLPSELIWELYASNPGQTGGIVTFPYCRVDTTVAACRTSTYMINSFKPKQSDFAEMYGNACNAALAAVVWVEVGFEGLENLARSRASLNWDLGDTDEERAQGILTGGAKLYRECLAEFVDMRAEHGITDDYFTQYGLEDTLYGIKTTKSREELVSLGVPAKYVDDVITVLSKTVAYEDLKEEFRPRKWQCNGEQFLMPVFKPLYLANPHIREEVMQQLCGQEGITKEVVDELVHGSSPGFAARHDEDMTREEIIGFITEIPIAIFEVTKNYLGLKRPSVSNQK